ncbi:GNAT family N-acetyltransferase [Anaerosolibacter sp.]|uniref:GNAT family N-acetyltransferase n=1 Tax=Anaerosolibacter sp. TaxID=1872527 RepID=UPI0039EF705D
MNIEKLMENLPELKTDRLTLRKFNMEDIDGVFQYASDPEVARYALWKPHKSMEESKSTIERYIQSYENHTGTVWGIYHNEEKKVIGSAGFIKCDDYFKRGEIGYTLARKYWGQGYATELLNRLIGFGFNQLNLHRIEGICHIGNLASARVMEKAGMIQEGILRGYFYKDNNHSDVRIYSIIHE